MTKKILDAAVCVANSAEDKLLDTSASLSPATASPSPDDVASRPAIDFDTYRTSLWDKTTGVELLDNAILLGMSERLCIECGIGYDTTRKAYIIPVDEYSAYTVALAETDSMPLYEVGWIGTASVYKPPVTVPGDCIYVVQDPVSAIALLDVGYPAISVDPQSVEVFKHMIQKHDIFCPLVIWPSHTNATEAAMSEMLSFLDSEGYPYRLIKEMSRYDYPAVALQHCDQLAQKCLRDAKCGLDATSTADKYIQLELDKDLNRFAECKNFVSGFDGWDSELKHFGPGVTILCAEPGAGKSTLVMQIATNLAKKKVPVMIFSTELSRGQMVSKFISSMAFELDNDTTVSAQSIQDGLTSKEIDVARKTWATNVAPYITIRDDVKTAERIAAVVKERVRSTGVAPLVIVDYLQRLQSDDPSKASDPRLVNSASSDILCALGTELTLPILVISSIGRSQYGGAGSIGMAKESGSIEYDAVCLLQLAPTAAFNCGSEGDKKAEAAAQKAAAAELEKPIRDMTVNVLKNRYGKNHSHIRLRFMAEHDTYEDFFVKGVVASKKAPTTGTALAPGEKPF